MSLGILVNIGYMYKTSIFISRFWVDFLTPTVFRSSVPKELRLCFSRNTVFKHLLAAFGQKPKPALVAQAASAKIDKSLEINIDVIERAL